MDDFATALDSARQATRTAQQELAKAKVMHHFGLSPADEILLNGDEDTMVRQGEAIREHREQQALRPPGGNHVSHKGHNPGRPPPDPMHVFVRELFNTGEYP